MSMLCLNVCRLSVPNIMSLGVCFIKKTVLVKVGAFAWYSVKIRVIFGIRMKDKKLTKKQAYTKTETCKLYSRVFWIFLPNFIKIDRYNFVLYRFKVGAFFWDTAKAHRAVIFAIARNLVKVSRSLLICLLRLFRVMPLFTQHDVVYSTIKCRDAPIVKFATRLNETSKRLVNVWTQYGA